jgi:hypothetical protein
MTPQIAADRWRSCPPRRRLPTLESTDAAGGNAAAPDDLKTRGSVPFGAPRTMTRGAWGGTHRAGGVVPQLDGRPAQSIGLWDGGGAG